MMVIMMNGFQRGWTTMTRVVVTPLSMQGWKLPPWWSPVVNAVHGRKSRYSSLSSSLESLAHKLQQPEQRKSLLLPSSSSSKSLSFSGTQRHITPSEALRHELKPEQIEQLVKATESVLQVKAELMSHLTPVGAKFPWKQRADHCKLQRTLNSILRYYSVDTDALTPPEDERRDSNSSVETGQEISNANTCDNHDPNSSENVHRDVFSLTKKSEIPEPPENAILSFYGSKYLEIKAFAKERGVNRHQVTKKLDAWKAILESFSLPENQVFITEDDVQRSAYKLLHVRLCGHRKQRRGTSEQNVDSKPDFELTIQYPEEVADGNYPISPFIYISTSQEARAALALLAEAHLVKWRMEAETEALRSYIERSQSEVADTTAEAAPDSSSSSSFSSSSSSPSSSSCKSSKWTLERIHEFYNHGVLLQSQASPLQGDSLAVGIQTTGPDPYEADIRLITLAWPGFPTFIFDVVTLWGTRDESKSLLSFCKEGTIAPVYGVRSHIDEKASELLRSRLPTTISNPMDNSLTVDRLRATHQTVPKTPRCVSPDDSHFDQTLQQPEQQTLQQPEQQTLQQPEQQQQQQPEQQTLQQPNQQQQEPEQQTLQQPNQQQQLQQRWDAKVKHKQTSKAYRESEDRLVRLQLWAQIKFILEDNKLTKIVFDGKFAYKFLRRHFGCSISYPLKDLMLDAFLYEVGTSSSAFSYNLNLAVEKYLKFQFLLPRIGPQHRWTNESVNGDQLLCAARDVAILPYLLSELMLPLRTGSLSRVSELEAKCMRGVAEIELNGINVDKDAWDSISDTITRQVSQDGEQLRQTLGWKTEETVHRNINSPRQVLQALQDQNVSIPLEEQVYPYNPPYKPPLLHNFIESLLHTAIPTPRKEQSRENDQPESQVLENSCTRHDESDNACGDRGVLNIHDDGSASRNALSTGGNSLSIPHRPLECSTQEGLQLIDKTDYKTLKAVVPASGSIEALLKYRKTRKLQCAFVNSLQRFVHPKTGRIHPEFFQTGTISGRFSCKSPNLQQVPRDERFRRCFTASDGCKLVICDMSQIELRVAADVAPDFHMIAAFSKGLDLHKVTAGLLRGVDMERVTKADRQLAKAVNFGLIYGMSAKGLKEYAKTNYGVEMDLSEAGLFKSKYFDFYKGIATWHRQARIKTRSQSSDVFEGGDPEMLITRTRSNRRAIFPNGIGALQKLLNYPVQGTAADMMKESIARLIDLLPQVVGRLVLCVHDEIIVEVPAVYAEQALELVQSTVKASGDFYFKHLSCETDGAICDSWADKP